MKNIIETNYESTVKRGLINRETSKYEFISKIKEEVMELEIADMNRDWKNFNEELADIILVCLNFAKHYNIDIEKELINKIKINYNRI